jgi:uroporphyrinogen-III synthase
LRWGFVAGNTAFMAKQSRHLSGDAAIPVLLTRPEAQSVRLGTALAAKFGSEIRLLLTPLMRMVPLTPEVPDVAFSAIVFTSEAGVEAADILRAANRGWPGLAFCVGTRTAEAARKAGFKSVSADGDAEALIALLVGRKVRGPLLYLHGRETRGGVAERLNSAGIETVARVVYQQDPQPLSPEAITVLQGQHPVIIPIRCGDQPGRRRRGVDTVTPGSLHGCPSRPGCRDRRCPSLAYKAARFLNRGTVGA